MKEGHSVPRIVLTPGEPAGIGPDIVLMLARQALAVELVVVADPDLLEQRARQLGIEVSLREFSEHVPPAPHQQGHLLIKAVKREKDVIAGRLDPANSPYVLDTLREAATGCLNGRYQALVTGPVHKGAINEAGIPFTGHTEFLAEICGGYPVMMLVAKTLRVALATTHLPIKDVSAAITPTCLETVVRILHRDLIRRFGIEAPNILVCGLNPHAGESGHLGREEVEVISPVLERLRDEGIKATGPLPADTLFVPRFLKTADAVLAMYHDQGLPVLKHVGFGEAVNVTLGLPIIRTSVDHGTALELAGSGQAQASSLEEAVRLAEELARNQVMAGG